MRVMLRPIKVKALDSYRVWVKFSDNSEGIVDLSHLVGRGVFARLKEKSEFEKVYIDLERATIAWGDDLDICPDSLYMQITGKKIEDIFPNLKEQTLHA